MTVRRFTSGSDAIENVAVPLLPKGTVASIVEPSKKLTVPEEAGDVRVLTAAVKVTI